MDRVLRTILSIREIKQKHDDDFVDRLSRQYTMGILVMFAFIVTTKQFVGGPISCWCPAHFTSSHVQYTNTICWVSNTYYVPFQHRIPEVRELNNNQKRISYYQWVPLILMAQALTAFIPCIVWRFVNLRSGIDVGALMEAAKVCQKASYAEIREKTIRYMVNQIDKYLLTQRDYRKRCCSRIKQVLSRHCFLVGGKRHGNYLTVTYLIIKILYAANAVGMLFVMDQFLGYEYHVYGMYVMSRLLRGEDWTASERFPRVTLCSFKVRHQARLHDYVVQCTLTINLFNEKIFLILWFWYVLVALLTLVSFVQWVARSVYWPSNYKYVKKKLRAFETSSRSKATLSKFAQYYLRRDGILLIRLISINIGELVAAETLCGLWENYGPERRQISENPRSRRSGALSSGAGPGSGQSTMEVV